MNAKEAELVTEEFCLNKTNYNIAPGGFGGGYRYLNSSGLRGAGFKFDGGAQHLEACSKSGKINGAKNFKKAHALGKIRYDTFKGKLHTEEWKKNHSEIMKIKASGSNNSQYGSMWITNGTENKKIKNIDIIPEGWYKGRKIKEKH